MTVLRDYQAAAVEDLRAHIRSGDRRLLVCAPTGSGKTELAMAMIHRAVARGHRVAFLVERLVLIEQTVARLAAAGIPTGVQQAGHSGGSLYPVQLCSQQTLEARDRWPTAELVIVDECHVQRRCVTQWLRHGLTDRQVVIGLTATPFARGLGTTYERLVTVRTTNALIDEGWLIPLRVFAATPIDMTGATTDAKTGEWREKDLTERGRRIVGDIVSTWVTRTRAIWGGPVKTLVFSATVAHGADLCAAFTAAGYRFAQVSYQDGHGRERTDRIEQFRRGDLDGLISVDVLTRGFDVPDVLCLVDAHPYAQALGAYLQQLGRVMRPAHSPGGRGRSGRRARPRRELSPLLRRPPDVLPERPGGAGDRQRARSGAHASRPDARPLGVPVWGPQRLDGRAVSGVRDRSARRAAAGRRAGRRGQRVGD